MKGKLSLDSIVNTSDLNARMAAKKQSAYDRPSSVSDWSTTTTRRSPTDEHFPTNSVDGSSSSRKKRQGWTEVPTKRKVASGAFPTGEDPFAGMNTRINYQQEIERLKALVPKVDTKRRSFPTKPRPQSPQQQQQQQEQQVMEEDDLTLREHRRSTSSSSSTTSSSSWYDDDSNNNDAGTRAVSPPAAPPSLASSAQSSSFSDSQTSSVLSDDESESASSTTSASKAAEVITEEEKARFMAFVRKWAGGCSWQAWGNSRSISSRNNDAISFDDDSSLWAKSSPWESNRQRTLDNHYFSATTPSSITTTTDPFLHLSRQDPTNYYYNCNPHYYPIQQEQYPIHHHHLYTSTYYHEPKPTPHNSHPISVIGERNQPTNTSAFRGIPRLGRNAGTPFGVFVI